MADFTALKTAITNAIKQNGNQAITGNLLQEILIAMVESLGDAALNNLATSIQTSLNSLSAVDGNLANAINSEESTRQFADNSLSSAINSEASARSNADSALQQNINTESNQRQSTDTSLQNQITTEKNARIDAVNRLQGLINAINDVIGNGYTYGGIATPNGAPQQGKMFYIALKAGNYVNYGNVPVNEGINILKKVGNQWVIDRLFDVNELLVEVNSIVANYKPIIINGNVTNAPDEVDITSNNLGLLQFKDKAYSQAMFSGLGRKYLRKNIRPLTPSVSFDGFVENVEVEESPISGDPDVIFFDRLREAFVAKKDDKYYLTWDNDDAYVPLSNEIVYMNEGTPYRWDGTDLVVDDSVYPDLKNILTQDMMSAANTIYVIQYDFTLGEDITIPENCVLEFDGGSISGNKVVGNYTRITGITTTSNDTMFDGTFITDDNNYYASVFGILTSSEAIGKRLASLTKAVSRSGGGNIIFGAGIYYMGVHLENGAPAGGVRMYPNVHYIGAGISKAYENNVILSQGTVIRPNKTGEAFHSYFSSSDHMIDDVVFDNIEFNTYLGTGETDGSRITVATEDKRMAIAMSWSNNVIIRNCKFIGDFSSVELRYSHPAEQVNNNIWGNSRLNIEGCYFCAKPLSIAGYKDITFCGITAYDCTIRDNIFCIEGTPVTGGYYQNCALDIRGTNINIYNNVFRDFTNAIDWAAQGTYSKPTPSNIYNNKIYTTRGIGFWAGQNLYCNSINIFDNYFKPAVDFEYRWPNSSNCIALIKHATDSFNGNFKNITIKNNIFDYDDSYEYYLSLVKGDKDTQGTWTYKHQNIIVNSGYCFEDYFSTISIAPLGPADDIIIEGNIFRNSKICSVFTGGSSWVRNIQIVSNKFIDCSTDDYYTIFMTNRNWSNAITDNIYTDTKADTEPLLNINFIKADWIGQTTNIQGYPASASGCRWFISVILRNFLNRTQSTTVKKLITTGLSANGGNTIFDLIEQTNGKAPSFTPNHIGQIAYSQTAFYISNDTTNNGNWKVIPRLMAGTTANRPNNFIENTEKYIGLCYFDRTLGKPIYWTGTDWVDATGTVV